MLLDRKPIQARLIFTSCIRCPLLLSGAQTYILITEQVFTIGDMPKPDLQKLPYTLFQNTRKDEMRFAHVFSLLAGGGADKMILPFFKVLHGAVVQLFSAVSTTGDAGKEIVLAGWHWAICRDS